MDSRIRSSSGRGASRQHVVDHFRFVAGMADAESQPPEILADVRNGVAQSVVAAVTAALLQAHAAHRQIEFVVRDEDVLRRDLVEFAELSDRQTAAIHVGRGLQQIDFLVRPC